MATYDLEQTAALDRKAAPYPHVHSGPACHSCAAFAVASSLPCDGTTSILGASAASRQRERRTDQGRHPLQGAQIRQGHVTSACPLPSLHELKAWRCAAGTRNSYGSAFAPMVTRFVVTQADGNPVQPRSLTHEWMGASSHSELRRIRFHDLRHSHATHLLGFERASEGRHRAPGPQQGRHHVRPLRHVMPGMQDEAVAQALMHALRAVRKGPAEGRGGMGGGVLFIGEGDGIGGGEEREICTAAIHWVAKW